MLTPKEKAEELFNKFYYAKDQDGFHSMNKHRAVECAIIAVNQILQIQTLRSTKMSAKLDRYSESDSVEYWNEVLTELNNL